MAEKQEKESGFERASRVYRNVNALGAVAFAGLAIAVPAGALAFNTLAGVNALQAGGGEAARRWKRKKRLKSKKSGQ